MDNKVEILFLGSKICATELNVWLVGEGAKRLNLKERVRMTYGLSEISLPKGEIFDLIIVDYYCFRWPSLGEDDVGNAHKQYPQAKIILFAPGEEGRGYELFQKAVQFNAQIEFTISELAEKIRRFFFPKDFKEESNAA